VLTLQVVAEPVALAADMTLFWFPFYKSLKMLITLVVITWRLQVSYCDLMVADDDRPRA
jgi:hypothetical protein